MTYPSRYYVSPSGWIKTTATSGTSGGSIPRANFETGGTAPVFNYASTNYTISKLRPIEKGAREQRAKEAAKQTHKSRVVAAFGKKQSRWR